MGSLGGDATTSEPPHVSKADLIRNRPRSFTELQGAIGGSMPVQGRAGRGAIAIRPLTKPVGMEDSVTPHASGRYSRSPSNTRHAARMLPGWGLIPSGARDPMGSGPPESSPSRVSSWSAIREQPAGLACVAPSPPCRLVCMVETAMAPLPAAWARHRVRPMATCELRELLESSVVVRSAFGEKKKGGAGRLAGIVGIRRPAPRSTERWPVFSR